MTKPSPAIQPQEQTSSLYEQLGGEAALNAAVTIARAEPQVSPGQKAILLIASLRLEIGLSSSIWNRKYLEEIA